MEKLLKEIINGIKKIWKKRKQLGMYKRSRLKILYNQKNRHFKRRATRY